MLDVAARVQALPVVIIQKFSFDVQGNVAEQRTQLTEQMHNSSGSFELVLSAVILGLGGYVVDGWVGTRPLFMVLFTILGFVGAAASVYYRYKYEIAALNEETESLRKQARS